VPRNGGERTIRNSSPYKNELKSTDDRLEAKRGRKSLPFEKDVETKFGKRQKVLFSVSSIIRRKLKKKKTVSSIIRRKFKKKKTVTSIIRKKLKKKKTVSLIIRRKFKKKKTVSSIIRKKLKKKKNITVIYDVYYYFNEQCLYFKNWYSKPTKAGLFASSVTTAHTVSTECGCPHL
jgi:hypothetical protein